jgi:tripartite-type tricarboxylate transporter receptor subunit TctC
MGKLSVSVGLAAGLLALAASAHAQSYPSLPITLVVPFAPGGASDVVGRIIGEGIGRVLGQTVVIENVAGAGGTTGTARVAAAAPDGYTMVLAHTGTHAAAVPLYANLRYGPLSDFAPIGLINTNPIVVVAKKATPANSLQEFVAHLKANATRMNNAHAGTGSVSHTTCVHFNALLGVRPTEVAYRGAGPAMNDLVSGQVDYMCDQLTTVVPQAQAGTVKAFAVAQGKRSPLLPDVPTTAEAGLPEYQMTVWNALLFPKDTPTPVVDTMNRALSAALGDAAVRKRLEDLGNEIPEPALRTPDGLRTFIAAEIERWTAILRQAGVTAAN